MKISSPLRFFIFSPVSVTTLLFALFLAACTATPTPTVRATPTNTPFPSSTSVPPITLAPTETLSPTATPLPTFAPPSLIPEGALTQFGKGQITTLALSPDRDVLAIGSHAGVCLYRVEGYEEMWCTRPPVWKDSSWIRTLAFRPQGDVLAAGMTGGQVVLWDVEYGVLLAERAFATYEFVNGLAWSPDGTRLAVGSNHLQLASWDGSLLEPGERLRHGPTLITALSWSPDGEMVVWGEVSSTITLWNLVKGEAIASLELPNLNTAHAFIWTSHGELVIVGGSFLGSGCCYAMSGSITILNPRTGEIQREFDSLLWFDQGNDLSYSAISLDETMLAVGGGYYREEGVAVLDLETGELLARLPNANREAGVVWLDGARLLMIQGQTLVQWSWKDGDVTSIFTDYYAPAVAATWSPDGTMLASTHAEYHDQASRIVIWDAQTGQPVRTVPRDAWVAQVWWLADGTELLWAEAGEQVYALNTKTGEITPRAKAPHHQYLPIEPSPDGLSLAVTNLSETNVWETSLWDLTTGEQSYKVEFDGQIECIAWSPDGTQLALCYWAEGDEQGTIILLDSLTGERQMTVRPEFSVQSLSWSTDGTRLAGVMGGWLAGWDVQTGDQLWKTGVSSDGRPIASVAFGPQTDILATGGQNIVLWNAPRLLFDVPIATFSGQVTPINGVLFSPDGRRLASLSDDGTIVVWEMPK